MTAYNYVTSTLLNAYLYLIHNEYAKSEDFERTLNRERFEPTDAMLAGIEFEEKAYRGEVPELLDYVKGGLTQVDVEREYNGILVLGKADLITVDWIYDIKCTNRYNFGKYFHSSQHLIYPFCTGINQFEYLVWCNNELHTERYLYRDGMAESLIDEFIEWLKVTKRYEIWKEKWRKYRNDNKN